MSVDYEYELDGLLYEADGPAKIAGMADLVRRLDAAGQPGDARACRWELLTAAEKSELCDDHVLPTFAALLADHDADPDAADAAGSDTTRLLEAYRSVLRYVTRYPTIPRDRIEGLLTDFAERVAAWGGDEAAACEAELHCRGTLGDLDAVPGLCKRMAAARERAGRPRGWDAEVLAGIYTAQPDLALAAMAPMLDGSAGWLASLYRPTFLDWSLRPLGWLSRDDEAEAHFAEIEAGADGGGGGENLFADILRLEYAARRLVRLGRGTPDDLLPRLTRLLDAAAGLGPSFRSQAWQVCGFACEALADRDDRPRPLRLPGDDPDAPAGDRVRPPSAAVPALAAATADLTAAFNARNGNDYLSEEVDAGNRQFVFGPGTGVDRVPAARRARLRALWDEPSPTGTGGDR